MFRFTANDIEYVSTLCPSDNGNYLVGMGVNESECWIGEVGKKTINDLLIYNLQASLKL